MNKPLTKEEVQKLPARSETFSGFTATSDGENRKERRTRVSYHTMEFNNRKETYGRYNFRVRQRDRFGVIPVLFKDAYRDYMTVFRFRQKLSKTEKKKLAEWFAQYNYSKLYMQAYAIRTYTAEIFSFIRPKKKSK